MRAIFNELIMRDQPTAYIRNNRDSESGTYSTPLVRTEEKHIKFMKLKCI